MRETATADCRASRNAAPPSADCHDANGNLTSDGATTYAYDVENRLTGGTGAKVGTLAYDPLGRLFETSGGAPGTARFLYDADELVLEYNSSGTVTKRYVHGTAVDDPVVEYVGSGLATRRFLHSDHQGTIVAATSCGANLTAIYRYDEYGVPAATNASVSSGGRFGYTGQIWIPELGLWYYKARMYCPECGRFLQVDPVAYDDQVNLYAYVGNDPMNILDPTGEWGWVAVGAFINGAIQARAEYKAGHLRSWGAVGRITAAAASGAVGGGAAGSIARSLAGKGIALFTARTALNAGVGGTVSASQAEANARLESKGARGASRAEMTSAASQGALLGALGSAGGEAVAVGAYRGFGGAAKEAAMEADEVGRMISGQGFPGGSKIDLGPSIGGVYPSQAGAIAGQAFSTFVGAGQPPAEQPTCSKETGSRLCN